MKSRKVSYMPYVGGFLLAVLVLAGPFLFPASRVAHAHTFSTSESAQFLSLVEQIRAEMGLVTLNLENNNATLAREHAERAANILSNSTIDEIRERNNRVADTLESSLLQLKDSVTPSSNVTQQEQIPQDRIQSISQTVQSLNDTLSEAVTVRVESEQQNNATTWAMVLANLTNTILSKYGNATGAAFDLTDETNLSGIEGEDAQVSGEGINNSAMPENRTTSNVTTSTIIVDEAAYQTAQYLANNTVLQLFNDMLKPFTTTGATGLNGTTAMNIDNITTAQQQLLDNGSFSTSNDNSNNATAGIDELEKNLLQLRDNVNSKASPNEVMTIARLKIYPMLIQLYGLTPENEEEEDH
jgi:hypothetical protein